MIVRDCEFKLKGITLRGRRWGIEGAMPVLALHGWLDNCASFDFLAPLITSSHTPQLDLVTLDLAGHGLSDHRPALSAYNIWQDLVEILLVTKQLGWSRFALIGHSRGAMITTLLAATYPEKITHLVGIEGLVPGTAEADQAPAQLRMAIDSIMSLHIRPFNYHPSFDAAVKAREQGFMPLTHLDALALAKRGVRRDDQGYYWGSDPKLLAPSEIKFTPGQIAAFTNELHKHYVNPLPGDVNPLPSDQKPIAVFIVGNKGIKELYADLIGNIKKYPGIKIQYLEGDHHLHMSVGAAAVSQVITEYFQT